MKSYALGFGLIEILTAILLLGFALLAVINGLLLAQQHTIETRTLTHSQLEIENDDEAQYGGLSQ